jgi:hypothetical protein
LVFPALAYIHAFFPAFPTRQPPLRKGKNRNEAGKDWGT